MKYFMVLTAKEMLFSTDILFSQFFWFKDSIFSRRFCKIQGHFWVFYNTWEPRLFVKPYGCSIFYFSDFHLYPFKTMKNIYFQPKYNYYVFGCHI